MGTINLIQYLRREKEVVMYHLGKVFHDSRNSLALNSCEKVKAFCGSGRNARVGKVGKSCGQLQTPCSPQSGDCLTVMNLIPKVLVLPFPLASWAVPHASQTQQTPSQTQSGSSLNLFFPGSIIFAKRIGVHLPGSIPNFSTHWGPTDFTSLSSLNCVLPSLFPSSLLPCPGLVYFYLGYGTASYTATVF